MELSIQPSKYLLLYHPVYKTSSNDIKAQVVLSGSATTLGFKYLGLYETKNTWV